MTGQIPLITNDAVVLGLLMSILGLVFWSSESKVPFFTKFYNVIPPILLCYFLPGLLNSFGVISGETSSLYTISSRYLLPASLVLFTLLLFHCNIHKTQLSQNHETLIQEKKRWQQSCEHLLVITRFNYV